MEEKVAPSKNDLLVQLQRHIQAEAENEKKEAEAIKIKLEDMQRCKELNGKLTNEITKVKLIIL